MMPNESLPARCVAGLPLAIGAIVLLGCRQGPDDQEDAGAAPPQGTSFALLVVDDPELARVIRQWETEWHGQTGFGYQVSELDGEEFAASVDLDADIVICPSYLWGPLAEDGRIVPMPLGLIKDDAGRLSEVFSLLRVREAAWGSRVFAVPFGSPVLICYWRRDIFERLGCQPPETWQEYGALAERLASHGRSGVAKAEAEWYGTIEPLGPGWAGIMLLARAAPYVTHRELFSALFDLETMKPLVAGPPFVQALEELAASAAWGPPEQIQYDPQQVRAAFWQGRAAMAVSWPSAAAEASAPAETMRIGLARLPGSPQVFNFLDDSWEARQEDEQRWVPLLGAAGRAGVVTAGCSWPEAAFQLLLWLSGPELSRQVSTASRNTTLFRRSHLGFPQDWVEEPLGPEVAAEYAALTEETLSGQERLFALRIPGRTQYLDALDRAVRRVLAGQAAPQEALEQAAVEWEEITDRLGRPSQRSAYLHSLGEE
ncbi:MAG TPA: extracellular solute-binding protein [Planctomycetes bacterium]|nr:extracellular solute-binding protein [Planctomycetota bacterium]